MSGDNSLDCLLLGHYAPDPSPGWDVARAAQVYSGSYAYVTTNTILLETGRMSYGALLNRVLERHTGESSALHVATMPHLGCHYLKSYLARCGIRCEVINFVNQEEEELRSRLEDAPLAVAISTTLYTENRPIVELIKKVRASNPQSTIIVGGPHIFGLCSEYAGQVRDSLLAELGADIYIWDSQGEATLARVVTALRRTPTHLDGIPNLAYRVGRSFRWSDRVPEHNDLDQNSVDWNLAMPGRTIRSASVRTARSCPFACSFCRYPIMGGRFEVADLETVRKELRQLAARGVTDLAFVDDTLNVSRARFAQLCRMMLEERFAFRWYCYLRCSGLDEEIVKLMVQSRCRGVFLGIESGDDLILRNMNKRTTADRMRDGLSLLRDHGIATFACFIVGFPGETQATVERTMEFIEQTKPTFYRAEMYFHDPRSPIQQQAESFGIRSRAFSWSHKSMTWQSARDHVKTMYRQIHGSTILPISDFDFWSLPYYEGEGIPVESLRDFCAVAGKMLVATLDDSPLRLDDYERDLVAPLSRLKSSNRQETERHGTVSLTPEVGS